MGDETWASIQLVKSKRESFREKLKRRKAERDTILSVASGSGGNSPISSAATSFSLPAIGSSSIAGTAVSKTVSSNARITPSIELPVSTALDSTGVSSVACNAELERSLLEVLSESVSVISVDQLISNPRLSIPLGHATATGGNSVATVLGDILQKFAYKELISVSGGTVTNVQHNRVTAALELTKSLKGNGPRSHSSPCTSSTNTISTASNTSVASVVPTIDTTTATATTTCCTIPPVHSAAGEGGEKSVDGGEGGAAAEAKERRVAEGDTEVGAAPPANKKVKTSGPTSAEKDDVMSLLSAPTIRERENKRVGEEILELLNKPTAREQSVAQHFRSQGGAKVREFCPYATAEECHKWRVSGGRREQPWLEAWDEAARGGMGRGVGSCGKLHFRKIIQPHTDEALGDCSFLNTCFHMDTCRYVHYEVDYSGMEDVHSSASLHRVQLPVSASPTGDKASATHSTMASTTTITTTTNTATTTSIATNSAAVISSNGSMETAKAGGVAPQVGGMMSPPRRTQDRTVLFPPQWIQCDLRFLDMAILGKFAVIMADPPWDIHMELPYGTMSDDEMRQLNIPALQDEGLMFLWVTGRAMELGRECLTLWGYERVDEIIWVKTNQLQRIIRTGRTGHWLNHGKEHCLVGMKGIPAINRCMDCDVIVAEVRATSHKPDEIYGIIERLSPGTRKIELFGRHHNVQPNWLTLGNQLEGVNLLEEDLIRKFQEHHPNGVANKL